MGVETFCSSLQWEPVKLRDDLKKRKQKQQAKRSWNNNPTQAQCKSNKQKISQVPIPRKTNFEGLPGVLGNIGKISKRTIEHEPVFREQGNKTQQIKGRKGG